MGKSAGQIVLKKKTRRGSLLIAPVLIAALGSGIYWIWWPTQVSGFGTYLTNIPNSNVNSCNTCHGPMGPGSATSNNQFKADFAANSHSWSAALATKDSDGDGFTDGEELQDAAGAWTMGSANPGNAALVSSPSDANSMPPAPTMTAFMGVTANSTVSNTVNLTVALSTVAGGTPVGITRVDYVFKIAGTSTVVNTFSSTTAAAFPSNIDTRTVANQAYDITATCFDKRSAGSGGPRTATMKISNVTVANKPVITLQPVDAVVAPGGNITFTIAATGATSFQWQKGGSNISNGGTISNATTVAVTITGVVAADSGLYSCNATNAAGTTSSSTATLVVGSQSSNSYVKLASLTTVGISGSLGATLPGSVNGTFNFNATNRPINGDGRIILFRSGATNMNPALNTNGANQQVWARNLKAGTTLLVSANTTGNWGSGGSSDTCIVSADGNFVAFNSQATDLTTIAPGASTHVYRRDLVNGTTIPVGVRNGVPTITADFGVSNTNVQCISQDGRYIVVFYDGSTVYDPTKTNTTLGNYYMRDCTSNTTTLVNVNSAGTGTRTTGTFGGTTGIIMTPDGRFVTFSSDATDLGPVAGNGKNQVYLWDRTNPNTLTLVSSADGASGTTGAAIQANQNCGNPSISSDGRYISFESTATNLNANHSSGTNFVIYRRDLQTNKTDIVSQASGSSAAGTGDATASAISASGQFVVYVSTDSNLVTATDNNTFTDVFRRDMNDSSTGKNVIVSSPNGGSTFVPVGGGASQNARISDDARFVAFESNSTALVTATDTNAKTDIFRRDCQTNSTILLSIRTDLLNTSNGASVNPFLSGNGLTAMFLSDGSNLVPASVDTNTTATDIFSATFNAAPTVAALTNASVAVGVPFMQSGSFTDPNGPDTFTATVDYGDGSGIQPLTLAANNTFALNHTYMQPGAFNVLVSVIDSANGVGKATAIVTVTNATAAPGLISSANPAGFGQSITFTASVAGASGFTAPTGVVTFNDGSTAIGSAALSAGSAAFSISGLAAGSHSITAVYSGDVNYSSATSAALAQTIDPSLPVITSPTALTVAINTPFTYQITATGSAPIVYTVSGLPAGLSFDTDTISGMVANGGLITIQLTATNSAGTSFQGLSITVPRPAAGDNAPTITSPASAVPNPVSAGSPVTFTAAATDPDGDFVGYLWDYGDGTTGAGLPSNHVYAAAGTYNVTLTVSDSVLTATSGLTIAVTAAGSGGSGTAFTAGKGALKFNFSKANSDSLTLSGTLPLGAGFNPNSKSVQVIFGGYSKQFSFDAKGKSALKLTGKKAKDGSFSSATEKFSLSLKNQSIYNGVSGLGFASDTAKATIHLSNIEVILVIDGKAFFATLKASYKATKGKTGSAALTP